MMMSFLCGSTICYEIEYIECPPDPGFFSPIPANFKTIYPQEIILTPALLIENRGLSTYTLHGISKIQVTVNPPFYCSHGSFLKYY